MGKYFTIGELAQSETADRLGIPNRIPKDLAGNVAGLISLNKAVGGVADSFHLEGCAADIDTRQGRKENEKLFEHIRANLPFTELGWEGGGRWIHVALVPGREEEKEVFYA